MAPARVLIHFGVHSRHFRDLALAMRRYGRESGRMIFPAVPAEFDLALGYEILRRFDGVAALVATQERESMLVEAGLPTVNFSDTLNPNRLVTVTSDSTAVGRMAADHFLSLGFRSFAYWGDWSAEYSRRQCAGFRARVGEAGEGFVFSEAPRLQKPWIISQRTTDVVRSWIRALPKPVALLGAMDLYASVVTEVALEAGFAVPDDVAPMGVGDDDFYAHFGHVPLTSIRLPSEPMGRQIGKCLERMLDGEAAENARVEFAPMGVVERVSTLTRCAEHPVLRETLAFIRDFAGRGIGVDDVVARSGYSKSRIQGLFREHLDRSILEEIWEQRIRLIKDLLRSTNLTLDVIAERTGVSSAQRLCAVFRERAGTTPAAYRAEGELWGATGGELLQRGK